MVSLKNPDGQIPNGLKYLQSETGWDSSKMIGKFPSMSTLVRGVIAHRGGNSWLIQKHNWSTDFNVVLGEMRDYNARLCLEHGWLNYITTDEEPPAVANVQKKTLSASAAGGSIRKISAGIGVLLDWVGSGGVPVASEAAERRASICATCPRNDGGDWKAYFTEPIAAKIKQQLEIKHDLQLKTSHDDRLTVCSACDCPLQLKVWTPLEHILEHTSEEVKERLDPRCWILQEAASVSSR